MTSQLPGENKTYRLKIAVDLTDCSLDPNKGDSRLEPKILCAKVGSLNHLIFLFQYVPSYINVNLLHFKIRFFNSFPEVDF